MSIGLSSEQLNRLSQQGYLIVEGFVDQDGLQSLRSGVRDLMDKFEPSQHPKVKFDGTSNNPQFPTYFLDSAHKVSYFYEKEALDSDDNLLVEKQIALNKIGHGKRSVWFQSGSSSPNPSARVALHELNLVFRDFTLDKKIIAIMKDLGFKKPVVLQSMIIFKNPRIGGEVQNHQDSTFLHTDPPSAIGFWIPLDDCTPENGSVSFIPGSHKSILATRSRRIKVEI